MSNSLRPNGLQPARLLRGVGSISTFKLSAALLVQKSSHKLIAGVLKTSITYALTEGLKSSYCVVVFSLKVERTL